jgi:hypothetical protein
VKAFVRVLDPDGNRAVGRLELSSGLALLGLPLGGTEADELFDALNGNSLKRARLNFYDLKVTFQHLLL